MNFNYKGNSEMTTSLSKVDLAIHVLSNGLRLKPQRYHWDIFHVPNGKQFKIGQLNFLPEDPDIVEGVFFATTRRHFFVLRKDHQDPGWLNILSDLLTKKVKEFHTLDLHFEIIHIAPI
jgi:hypothetical protein